MVVEVVVVVVATVVMVFPILPLFFIIDARTQQRNIDPDRGVVYPPLIYSFFLKIINQNFLV